MIDDSMHGELSPQQKVVVANLPHCSKDIVRVKVCNVQLQMGGNDCGLFALANVTATLEDLEPSSLHFEQKLMH